MGAVLFLPVFPFSSVVPVRRQSGRIVSSCFLFIIIKECILKFYVFTFGCGGSWLLALRLSLVTASGGYSLPGILTEVASLVVEHRL